MSPALTAILVEYLLLRNKDQLRDIVKSSDFNRSYSVIVNFVGLLDESVSIGNGLLVEPEKYLSALNEAAVSAQKHILNELEDESKAVAKEETWKVKGKVFVRVEGLPVFGEPTFPCNNDVGFLVKINGTLVKAGAPKLLEHQRDYVCQNCCNVVTVRAVYEKHYIICAPSKCPECHSASLKQKQEIDVSNFIDYQEVKVQEHFGKSKVRAIPKFIAVTLEGDLVDTCKPGDDVIVIGILSRRWKALKPGARSDIELVLKANNLQVCNEQKSSSSSSSNNETKEFFTNFWRGHRNKELLGRNHILKSFCPQVYGMHLAKLAMVTVLAGGVEKADENGFSARGASHLLLVGDAGTGKSHLLRYASRVHGRSVFTTGVGSTTAGLTVAAVRENGDWNLEAGALVLADGGLCCIDDFNSIREHDRTSIHEAMEQQSISVAKAGIVTKLRTRCSIFATTGTKGKYDPSETVSVNVAISSPLLSRFDIVLILLDSESPRWDRSLCSFVLGEKGETREPPAPDSDKAGSAFGAMWSTSDIQNYLFLIKGLSPVMTPDAGIVLRTYYQYQRMADGRNAARTTVRFLESLIRLSQGHAKLMYRERVTVADAVTAISLIESSMLNATTSSRVMNALHTVPPDDPYDEYRSQATSILTKLKLHDVLEREMRNMMQERCPSTDVTDDEGKARIVAERALKSSRTRRSASPSPPMKRVKLNGDEDRVLRPGHTSPVPESIAGIRTAWTPKDDLREMTAEDASNPTRTSIFAPADGDDWDFLDM